LRQSSASSFAARLVEPTRLQVSKCHFRIDNGSLAKTLAPDSLSFCSFDAAEHLKKEGLSPRNVIEHSDLNFAAAHELRGLREYTPLAAKS
jgi:hypothetical protein